MALILPSGLIGFAGIFSVRHVRASTCVDVTRVSTCQRSFVLVMVRRGVVCVLTTGKGVQPYSRDTVCVGFCFLVFVGDAR